MGMGDHGHRLHEYIKVAWRREFTKEGGAVTSVCGLSPGNVQDGTIEKKLCLGAQEPFKAYVIG